jgi:tRNA A-37 threonylcarbamoyl transferase component Bud32
MVACPYCGTQNRADATYCNNCGGALKSTTPPAPPPSAQTGAPRPQHATGRLPLQSRLAGRYLIGKKVGEGGMAAVYQATDTRTNETVAVKEMSQDGLTPQEVKEALDAFRFEADTLMRLRHPNLPRVYAHFFEGARHYLVMEFIDGQTVEQRMIDAKGALPETEVMGWAEQLCSALNYLHMQRPPIIFRDLKPSNVMVTRAGKVKLIDFGIARVFAPGRARDTQILGTPGFAPPEQYGKAQTDARADVYALGCTLYQLLSNYDPATTPFALPPLNTRNPKVSPHIQLAIERATKLDRDQRFQSVADFERALLHPDGLYFRNGERARTLSELIALCQKLPQEGADALYSGRIEYWLRAWGNTAAANSAASAARTNTDQAAGLRAFLASASRRATASPNPAARIFQNIPRATVAQGAARTATAPTGTITVQPKSLHMGRLTQGQRGVQTIVVGGLPNSTVQGTITPLAPWLSVDRTIIRGASTLVQVFAETSKLPSTGVHQSQLVIRSGSQQVYLPVSVEALPAPASANKAQPPKSTAAPTKSTTAQPAQSAQKIAGPAASQTSARVKPQVKPQPKPAVKRAPTSSKFAIPARSPTRSPRIAIAGAVAVGAGLLPLAAFQWMNDPASAAQRMSMLRAYAPWWPQIPQVWPLLWLVFLASLAFAVVGAAAGHGSARWHGQFRGAFFGALIGLAAALLLGQKALFILPMTATVILVPALAGVGAAFGADALFGRGILAFFEVLSQRARFVVTIIAIIVGAWGGAYLVSQMNIGALIPLGFIGGAFLGASLASRLNNILYQLAHVPRSAPRPARVP